jgi:hypothetical protein
VRLSLVLQRPIHEVVTWPLWVTRTYAAFLSKEPAPAERLEWAIAHLHQTYLGAHQPEGVAPPALSALLLFGDAWEPGGLDPELERMILNDLEGRVK